MGVRLSSNQLKELGFTIPDAPGAPAARSKYHNNPTVYNGQRYDSRAEAERARTLDLLIDAGDILEVIRQPRFKLGVPENVYVADFLIIDRTIRTYGAPAWVEDVKGVRTAKFQRDVKLWRSYGHLPLKIISGKDVEWIIPAALSGHQP